MSAHTAGLRSYRRRDGTSARRAGTVVHVRLTASELATLDRIADADYDGCRSDAVRAAVVTLDEARLQRVLAAMPAHK